MRARAVAQPLRTWTQPLSLKNPAREQLSKLLITCRLTLAQVRQMIADGHPWFGRDGRPAVVTPGTADRALADVLRTRDHLADLLNELPATR